MKNMRKFLAIAAVLAAATSVSGCVPLVVGAGGAVAADSVAEDRGGNLF